MLLFYCRDNHVFYHGDFFSNTLGWVGPLELFEITEVLEKWIEQGGVDTGGYCWCRGSSCSARVCRGGTHCSVRDFGRGLCAQCFWWGRRRSCPRYNFLDCINHR